MTGQLGAFLCCCGSPGDCPEPPCPDCTPDSRVLEATASGTITTTVATYSWQVTPRSTTVVLWATDGACRWDTRTQGGSLDLVVSGSGSLAGDYVLSGEDFAPALACEPVVGGVRSRFLLPWVRQSLGLNRFAFRPFGTGPYTECAAGFVLDQPDDGAGLQVVNASEPVVGMTMDSVVLAFL